MSLNFPINPQPGDQYTGDNGVTYTYDGYKWIGNTATLPPGTNALVNNDKTAQLDALGNFVLPVGAQIIDINGDPVVSGPPGPRGAEGAQGPIGLQGPYNS